MALAAKVKRVLDSHHVSYRVLLHERTRNLREAAFILNIDQKQVVQTVLLKDEMGVVLTLLPLTYEIDLNQLFQETQRQFKILSSKETDKFFNDCEPGSHPPFGMAYGIPLILDKSIEGLKVIYFEAGCHTAMIQLSMDDFQFLMMNIPQYSFAAPSSVSRLSIDGYKENEMKVDFPEVPTIARQILEITHNHHSEDAILTLSNLISNDAILCKHVLRYAHPHLKKEKEMGIESLQEIITKILGVQTASHIAIGITAGRSFQIPAEGPLGLHTFWRHTLHSANLAKKIAEHIPADYGVDLHLSYLAGFFHNFGYLLLGHLFPHEFRLLNRWILLNPKTPIEVLEKRLLGMGQMMPVIGNGHARLGSWLMQYWTMPEFIVTVARFHHTEGYEGAYAAYVNLIQLTNQLLKAVGLGDGQIDKPAQKCLDALGLTLSCIENCIQDMQSEIDGLNHMAKELAN